MNVATPCDCCKEPIEGKDFRDPSCERPVCLECARNLEVGRINLNHKGMVGLYLGPCPDNGPQGLKKS